LGGVLVNGVFLVRSVVVGAGNFLDSEVFKLFFTLFLSFLIGLEREEKRASGEYTFGGVRTYPLLALMGYTLAFLAGGEAIVLAIGLGIVGGLMMLSYWHKMQSIQEPGLTSEVAGLTVYLVGTLVYHGHLWVASALVILSLLLLELKVALQGLAQRFSAEDILIFAQFLFLTLVVLPILPNQEFGPFQLNPFRVWLVVVAVSGMSYGSLVLQRVTKGLGGLALVALLGGAYSSTAVTVALAKRSSVDRSYPRRYSGAILMASGMMYLRLALLVSLFNAALGQVLVLPFGLLSLTSILGGWLWSRVAAPPPSSPTDKPYPTGNPLELRAAFVFAGLFVVIVIATHYTVRYLGQGGIYGLAAIMGITDVDPFILGLTQVAGKGTAVSVAAVAIVIATASNNCVKGGYALLFGERQAGRQSLVLLVGLAIVGLLPLFWLGS
jgi:uncharacterized membrane protein (DUF4010 family)